MIKNWVLSLFSLIVSVELTAQTLPLTQICTLPSALQESSGLEVNSSNDIFSHNDNSGGENVYKFNASGTLLRTLSVNAVYGDWEDMTKDPEGNMYIGDFGNNNNDQYDLKVFIFPNIDSITGNSINPAIINFDYPDRTNAPSGNHNFDCEAFFVLNDSLHLFSKNRTSPTTGWTKHYRLPRYPGTYTATLIDSFYHGNYRITGADMSPNEKTFVLLANNRIWIFDCFDKHHLFSGSNTSLSIANTQKEAVVFVSNTEIYISEEASSAKLYYANLSNYISSELALSSQIDSTCFNTNSGSILVSVSGGTLPYTANWSNGVNGNLNANLGVGNYILTTTDNAGCIRSDTFIVSAYASGGVPQITLSGNDLISSSGSSYQWYLNGVPVSGAASQQITPAANGTYQVEVVDMNGCQQQSSPYLYSLVGISELQSGNPLVAFPNPASATLQFSNSKEIESIEMVNVLGQSYVFLPENIDSGKVNISELPDGIYFVTVNVAGQLHFFKVLISQ